MGLVEKLNTYFRDLGSNGSKAPLLYVDVSKYEQAYSVRGQYQIKGNTVNLNAKLFKGDADLGSFLVSGEREGVDGLMKGILTKINDLIE